MENKNHQQLELFSQQSPSGTVTARKFDAASFFCFFRGYERNILIIICLGVICIISFALGVEQGKRIAMQKIRSNFDLALKAEPKTVKTVQHPPKANTPLPTVKMAPQQSAPVSEPAKINTFQQGFTIQLASFKSTSYAQKEGERIKKMGMAPIIIKSGNYTLVCVGNFSTKESANALLTQLKKQYQDCTVRRL